MTRTDVVAFCRKNDIALEVFTEQAYVYSLVTRVGPLQAWAPLVRGMRFKHPSIIKLAQRYSRTPAQILLRYSLQKVRLMMVFYFILLRYFTGIYPTSQIIITKPNPLKRPVIRFRPFHRGYYPSGQS
jgi:hypothetical protein